MTETKIISEDSTSRIAALEKENKELKIKIETLNEEIKNLKEAEEKYRRIFEAVPASIYVFDRNGVIIEINPYHIKQLGKGQTTKDDYLNQNVLMRPSIIQAGLVNKIKRLLAGEEFDGKEVYLPITSGGKDAYVNVRGVPLFRNDEIIGAILISEDVTQLKKNQEELLRYRERLEEIIEARTQELQKAYRRGHYSQVAGCFSPGEKIEWSAADLCLMQKDSGRRRLLASGRGVHPRSFGSGI